MNGFIDWSVSYVVVENVAGDSFKLHPILGQGAEEAAVFSFYSDGFPGAGFGVGPAGAVGVGEDSFSDDGGVGAVGAIEVDAFPVDELVAGVEGGEAHGVVIVDGPRFAF